MARRGFKIGNAYIEIYGDVNERQIRSESKEAGQEAAEAQGKEYEKLIKQMHEQAAKQAARSYAREAAKQQALYEGVEKRTALAQAAIREKIEATAAARRAANEEQIATNRAISLERIAIRAHERQMRLLEQSSSGGGRRAGDAWGRFFYGHSNRWIKRFKRALDNAIPASFIQSIGTITLMQGGMLALVAAAVLAATSLGIAGGSLAALIPIGAGVITAFTMLKRTFINFFMQTPYFKEFDKDLRKVRDSVNRSIYPGFVRLFDEVRRNMPMIQDHLMSIAAILTSGMFEIADLIKTEDFKSRLQVILTASEETVEQLSLIADDLLDAFVTIGAGASPIAEDFVRWINEIVTRFSNWIDAMYRVGKLQDFFKKAAEEAKKWGRIVENVVRGLWAIFQNVIPYADDFSTSIEKLSEKFKNWAQDEKTQKKIKDFLEMLKDLPLTDIAKLAAAFVAFGLAVKAVPAVAGIVQGILSLFALGPVGLVLAAIAASLGLMAGAFILVYTESEEFREKLGELWDRIKTYIIPAIKELWEWFQNKIVPVLGDTMATVLDSLIMWFDKLVETYEENKYWLDPLLSALKEAADFIFPGLIRVVGGLHIILHALVFGPLIFFINFIGNLITGIQTVIKWISQWATNLKENFGKGLEDAKTKVVQFKEAAIKKFGEFIDWVKGLPKRVYDALLTLKDNLSRRAREGFENFKTAAQQKWTEISTWVRDIPNKIRAAIGDAVQALKQKGRDFITGLKSGIDARWTEIRTWFTDLPNKIRSAIGALGTKLKAKGREILSSLWSGISERWGEIRRWFNDLDEKIKSAIGNLGDTLKGAGRAVLQGFLNGIKEKFQEIKDTINSIAPWIASHKGPVSYDLKLLVPNGEAIMTGLMRGIESQVPALQNMLEKVSSGIQAMPTSRPTTPADILGRGSAGGGGSGTRIYLAPGAVQINASDLKELADVRDFFEGIEQVARARGVV